jgi:hypothetical protein
MSGMSADASHELAEAGRRLRAKILIALTLSSVIPLLILAYVVRTFV